MVVDICPKVDSPPNKQGVRAFIDRVIGVDYMQKQQSSMTVSIKLVISGLTSVILIVLGTINLQFQGPFVPISLGSVFKLWQLTSWVQSGHHVVNFSTWCFGIYKTSHRIWLRILSIALEKELTGP